MVPNNSNIIYAGGIGGVFKSTDGGENWISISEGLTNSEILVIMLYPKNPNIIYAGTEGSGVFKYSSKITKIVLKFQIGNKTMYVNDGPLEIDVPPIIIEGRTLLPIRWVVEPLGASVGWDGVERKVTVTLGDIHIELWIGKSIAKVNGKDTPIDSGNPKVVPIIKDGRTMLPVRFVAENLGCQVDWDPLTYVVTITYTI